MPEDGYAQSAYSEHHVIPLALSQEQVLAEEQFVCANGQLRVWGAHVVDVNAASFDVLAGLAF